MQESIVLFWKTDLQSDLPLIFEFESLREGTKTFCNFQLVCYVQETFWPGSNVKYIVEGIF